MVQQGLARQLPWVGPHEAMNQEDKTLLAHK